MKIRTLLPFATLVVAFGGVGCANNSGPSAPDIDPNAPAGVVAEPGVVPAEDRPPNLDTAPAPAGVE